MLREWSVAGVGNLDTPAVVKLQLPRFFRAGQVYVRLSSSGDVTNPIMHQLLGVIPVLVSNATPLRTGSFITAGGPDIVDLMF